jgi:rod shape-determining protein MreD
MALRARARQEILLPVRTGFIALTLGLALFANVLPWPEGLARVKPDFLALTLLYWCIHHPRRVGFAAGWLLGIAMDVAEASLLGEHALAYTLLVYAGISFHRRVQMFGLGQQVLHVLPLLLLAQAVVLLVRMAAGADFPGPLYFVPSISGAALWPLLAVLFELPQRPRADPDQPAL